MNVLKDGEHIPNSPFKLLVTEGNASKVKAWGQGLEEGTANEVNEFTVDTKDAGQDHKMRPWRDPQFSQLRQLSNSS